jgi:hypothetical protein
VTDDSGVRAFAAHIAQLERRHGIDLDRQQADELLEASLAGGFNHDATETAFAHILERDYEPADETGPFDEDEDDGLDFEEEEDVDVEEDDETDGVDPRLLSDLEYGVAQVQAKIGRQLTHAEVQRTGEAVRDALARGGGPRDVHAAVDQAAPKPVADMTSAERLEFQTQRFTDSQGETDLDRRVREIHESEAGGFDVTDPEHRRVYVEARVAGYDADDDGDVEEDQ